MNQTRRERRRHGLGRLATRKAETRHRSPRACFFEPLEDRLLLSVDDPIREATLDRLLSAEWLNENTIQWTGEPTEVIQDQWIARINVDETLSTSDQLELANQIFSASLPGATVLEHLGLPGLVLVEAPGVTFQDMANVLEFSDSLRYIEPNLFFQFSAIFPNDPLFGEMWGLNNTGQTGGTFDADIDAPEAWDLTTGNPGFVVAVIDSGIAINHPDLVANLWVNPGEIPGDGLDNDGNGFIDDVHGFDFANNDGTPEDNIGHGTHVAGTIGAVGNNGLGVTGVNWDVQLMALKIGEAAPTLANAVRAINYTVLMRETFGIDIRLSNNSYGGPGITQAFIDAVSAANSAGMLFVAAAGNESSNNDLVASFPANIDLPNVISVAATDDNDQLAGFSNFGATTVHLGAPGVEILSTVPTTGPISDPSGFGVISGTSMSSPHVAGAAALVWSINPSATHLEVRDAIFNTVDPIPALAGITVTGGRLNVFQAAQAISPPPGAIDPVPTVVDVRLVDLNVVVTFSEPVSGVNSNTFIFERAGTDGLFDTMDDVQYLVPPSAISSDTTGTTWTFAIDPSESVPNDLYRLILKGTGATPYTFTKLADSTDALVFDVLQTAINDQGEVATLVTLDAGGQAILLSRDTGTTVFLDTNTSSVASITRIATNSSGQLVFRGQLDDGQSGIFLVDTSSDLSGDLSAVLMAVAVQTPFVLLDSELSLNDAGQVAFLERSGGLRKVRVGAPGSVVTVADSSGPLDTMSSLDLNNAGQVVFRATLDAGGQAIVRASVNNPGVLTTLVNTLGRFASFDGASINNNGTVAVIALTDAPSSTRELLLIKGGVVSTQVDENDHGLAPKGQPQINDSEVILFHADNVITGLEGVFTSSLGVTSEVARSGNPVVGGDESADTFPLAAINNNEGLAIVVRDVLSGVSAFQATPTPAISGMDEAGLPQRLDGDPDGLTGPLAPDGVAGGDFLQIFDVVDRLARIDLRLADGDRFFQAAELVGTVAIVGDWTGDGIDQMGIFNPTTGQFALDLNNNHRLEGREEFIDFFADPAAPSPDPGDIPIVGDWDPFSPGLELGIFRPSTGQWFLDTNGDRRLDGMEVVGFTFGAPGDIPVVGNFLLDDPSNPDSLGDEMAVFRPSTAQWIVDLNGNGAPDELPVVFGAPNNTPVVGNWDGTDEQDNIGVFDPTTAQWTLDLNGDFAPNGTDPVFIFGEPGDTPVVGNWAGLGRDSVGAFRSSTAQWFLDNNGNFVLNSQEGPFAFGQPGDQAAVGSWLGSGSTQMGVFSPSTLEWFLDLDGDRTLAAREGPFGLGPTSDTGIKGDQTTNQQDPFFVGQILDEFPAVRAGQPVTVRVDLLADGAGALGTTDYEITGVVTDDDGRFIFQIPDEAGKRLDEGIHRVEVQFVDLAGNVTVKSRGVRVDDPIDPVPEPNILSVEVGSVDVTTSLGLTTTFTQITIEIDDGEVLRRPGDPPGTGDALGLDPGTATLPANYRLIASGGDADGDSDPFNDGDEQDLSVAIVGIDLQFDPFVSTVTTLILTVNPAVLPDDQYRFIIRGTVTDAAGNPFDNGTEDTDTDGLLDFVTSFELDATAPRVLRFDAVFDDDGTPGPSADDTRLPAARAFFEQPSLPAGFEIVFTEDLILPADVGMDATDLVRVFRTGGDGVFAADGVSNPVPDVTIPGTATFSSTETIRFVPTDPLVDDYYRIQVISELVVDPGVPPNVNVSQDPANFQSEVQIAVNPTDPQNLVAFTHRFATSFGPFNIIDTFVSFDGGATWANVPIDNSVDGLGAGVGVTRFDPSVVFDANGHVYIAYGFADATTSAVIVARSTDGGLTYTATPVIVSSAADFFEDKWFLATGPDATITGQENIYITWTRFPTVGDFFIAAAASPASDTGGPLPLAFTAPVRVNDSTFEIVQLSEPAVGVNGELYVAWVNFDTGTIEFDVDPNGLTGGLSFGTDITVGTTGVGFAHFIPAQPERGIQPMVSVDVDHSAGPFQGRVYVSYTDTGPFGGFDTEIVSQFADPSDLTNWSSKVLVNDDGLGGSQFLGWLDVDPTTGTVVAIWYDTRRDPANEKVDVFLATSTDGGVTFGPNQRVSAGQSDQSGFLPPAQDYLEYIGVDAFGGVANVIWSDNSTDLLDLETFFAAVPIPVTFVAEPVVIGVTDLAGNVLDGEALGFSNPAGFATPSNPDDDFQVLFSDGRRLPGLSGDGLAGGDFISSFIVAGPGNVIFARADYDDDPLLTSDDPDGTVDRPFPTLQRALGMFDFNGDGIPDPEPDSVAGKRASGETGPIVVQALESLDRLTPFVIATSPGSGVAGTLFVPDFTALVFDPGTIMKLQNSNLDVAGQGAVLQVNGQPAFGRNVTFTSFKDDTISGDTNGDGDNSLPRGGDWGGLVFRDGADDGLSIVDFAAIRFGGGPVPASLGERFDPIFMASARPAITNSLISEARSAQAAISANVDSMQETALARGPLVRDVTLINNSINGIWVRPEDLPGVAMQTNALPLNSTFTFDDPVPYVFTSILSIGEALLLDADTSAGEPARVFAPNRFNFDPGVVVKFQRSAGIEMDGGSTLNIGDRQFLDNYIFTANAGPQLPPIIGNSRVIFTSLRDDAATTGIDLDNDGVPDRIYTPAMDSNNDGSASVPTPGSWGGIGIFPGATIVADEADFRFGGAENLLPDGNASRSVLEFGPGFSGLSTVPFFVSITNNNFLNNLQAAIHSKPNFLRAGDPTNPLFSGNPFFRGNVFQNNEINGLEILTNVFLIIGPDADNDIVNLLVDGLWDDTDLIHVVRDFPVIPIGDQNFFVDADGNVIRPGPVITSEPAPFQTLTLQSAAPGTVLANGERIAEPGESLIVKFFNETPAAALGAENKALNIGAGFQFGFDDGIDTVDADTGLQNLIDQGLNTQLRIIGIRGNEFLDQDPVPVILTSLRDDTAGTVVRGVPLFDTNNDGTSTIPEAGDGGIILIGGLTLTDYNLNDPSRGSIIETADIRFMTRVQIQGGSLQDIFDLTDPDFGPPDDEITLEDLPDFTNPIIDQRRGTGVNSTQAMTIADSAISNMRDFGIVATTPERLLARNVGPGDTGENINVVSRIGDIVAVPAEILLVNSLIANNPIGVQIFGDTDTGTCADPGNATGDPNNCTIAGVDVRNHGILLHNTFFNNATGVIIGPPGGTGNVGSRPLLMNNIFANSTVIAVDHQSPLVGAELVAEGPLERTVQFNLFFANTDNGFIGQNPLFGNPLFVDPVGGDFRLRLGSAAIDAALSEFGPNLNGDFLKPVFEDGVRSVFGRSGAVFDDEMVALFTRSFVPRGLVTGGPNDSLNLPGNPGFDSGMPIGVLIFSDLMLAEEGGERDFFGFQRLDEPEAPNIGFGRHPFFDIGAVEFRDLGPPVVTNFIVQRDTNLNPTGLIGVFNEDLDPATVFFAGRQGTFIVEGSGGDGSFVEGNETIVSPSSPVSFDPLTNEAFFDLSGQLLPDDLYRVILKGSGFPVMTDLDGIRLDGEFDPAVGFPSGDGFPGGDFIITFSVDRNPPVIENFRLDPATDSAPVGDNITDFNQPAFLGTVIDVFPSSIQGLPVELDVDGDGFDDGSTVTDVNGDFRLQSITVMANSDDLDPNLVDEDGRPVKVIVGGLAFTRVRARVIDQGGNQGLAELLVRIIAPPDLLVDINSTATNPNGLSPQTAFPSIQQAINAARPGQRVIVLDGIYDQDITLRSGIPVLSDRPGITVRTDIDGDGDFDAVPGDVDQDGLFGPRDTFIRGTSSATVTASGVTQTALNGFTVMNIGVPLGVGIRVTDSDVLISSNIIVLNSTGIDVQLASPSGLVPSIENNVIWANINIGVDIRNSLQTAVNPVPILNNTFVFNNLDNVSTGAGLRLQGQQGLLARVVNNIFSSSNRIDLDLVSGNAEIDFNLFAPDNNNPNVPRDANNKFASDPLFVFPIRPSRGVDPIELSRGNFRLRAGSPAIDAGTSDGTPLLDQDLLTRVDDPNVPNTGGGTDPFFDIGAYERGGVLAAPLSTTAFAGVFRNGTWFLDLDGNGGNGESRMLFGMAGDRPFVGDFDGDGAADFGVFRRGTWYFDTRGDGFKAEFTIVFGMDGDIPLAGDFDGDGRTDAAIFRNGAWFLDLGNDGFMAEASIAFGLGSDIPVVGDFDGNGQDDLAVFRNGTWFIDLNLSGGAADQRAVFGIAGDIPVAGDFNGDGRDDIAVFRNGTWFFDFDLSGGSADRRLIFGIAGDVPVAGAWRGAGATQQTTTTSAFVSGTSTNTSTTTSSKTSGGGSGSGGGGLLGGTLSWHSTSSQTNGDSTNDPVFTGSSLNSDFTLDGMEETSDDEWDQALLEVSDELEVQLV